MFVYLFMYVYIYIGDILGGMVANVAKSMLPVSLVAESGINITAISNHYKSSSALEVSVEAVVQLDVGTTKRSTVLKKLLAISNRGAAAVNLIIQVDAPVILSDGSTSTACLFTFAPTVKELQSMISVCCNGSPVKHEYTDIVTNTTTSTTFTLNLINQTVEFAHSAINGTSILRNQLYANTAVGGLENDNMFTRGSAVQKQLVNGWCVGSDGLVNAFWVCTLQSFYELALDIFYLVMCMLTLCAPWRFLQMIVALLEPVNRWPWRIGTKSLGMFIILYAFAHLICIRM